MEISRAIEASTVPTYLASPSSVDVNNKVFNPLLLRDSQAAKLANLLFPTTTVKTFLNTWSSALGVSGMSPFSPSDRTFRMDFGTVFHSSYFFKI